MSNHRAKYKIIILAMLGLLFVAAGFLAAICIGAKEISLDIIWDSLVHYNEENIDMLLIRDSRMPRAVAAILIGGMLSLTGATMQ